MMRNLERELEMESEGRAEMETWSPQPGETLVGRIVGYISRVTKRGPARLAVVEREDGSGRIQVWITAIVLKSAFEEQKPRAGDRVGIRYNGRHETKSYHLYSLVVDRDEQQSAQPYAKAAMAGQAASRSGPAPAVSMGPGDEDSNDPFAG
jgi:hypothetical protein